MTATPLPYFFDEAQRASTAKEPGEREKALHFTLDDLKWLKNVYLATHTARIGQTAPMHVYQVLLTTPGSADIPLAGAFAMSRPSDGEVTLYTPWKGLIKFTDLDDLKSTLKAWLSQDTGKRELLRFLSIEQRCTLLAAPPGISTRAIDGAVFQDQQLLLDHNQTQNITTMMAELVQMPSLQSMLDDALNNALRKPFPKLDQRLTRLKSFFNTISTFDNRAVQQTISSLSLSDALLHVYLTNQWPVGDARAFAHPTHGAVSDADTLAWENAIKEIAQSFTPHLRGLLDTFWNTATRHGLSRREFFCEGLRDTFHTRLLLLRQEGVLTTREYLFLMKVSLAPSPDNGLRIEKVRVTAPFKHPVELASTLMIGGADTLGFLYTQSRGIEATSDLSAVKTIILQMMKSEGHEDTLLNFMSLDERAAFLAFEPHERLIEAEPVTVPVFEQLMDDILGKQQENLAHALSRYRESEGSLVPHALIDKALDVRGLIDDRLLEVDAAGRWSTQVDRRWSAQQATVRAESANVELALLDSVEQALDQVLEQHPVIPPTTASLAEAQRIVGPSMPGLQSNFTHTLAAALRSELRLRAVTRTLDETEQAIIRTVLDTPIRRQRAALNGFLPDVFSLALNADEAPAPLRLASCFLLTERGGLDPEHSGKAIVWTPASGFEAFQALTPLLSELDRRLKDDDQCATLLENLGRSERLPGRQYSLAPLQCEHGHFIDALQKPHVHLDPIGVTHALTTKLPPAPMSRLLKVVALREPRTGLDRPMDIARSLTTQQKLPAWLAKASINDLVLHAELLQQYLNNVKDDEDYLSGIRSLRRTAHDELAKQLKADGFDIDPDKVQIQINARLTSPASTQLLTDFALTPIKDLDPTRFTVVSLDTRALPAGMNETYIKGLIRNLKPGEHQQKILRDALADTPANADRRQRFNKQLPWQLMHYAHTEKLQDRLSDTSFDLIRQVMDMPDTLARLAVDDAHAIIRPLELLGIKDAHAMKVPGVYLISSTVDRAAPHVLIAPHSPRHGVKEYESERQLLAELKSRGSLLDWILTQLPPPDRTLLEQRMATTGPRLPEVTLGASQLQGHLFTQLFEDNSALLGRLLGCQSDEHRQSEWTTIRQVLGEDLHEAYSFFMGRLAFPLTVWRSYLDLQQSAEALQTHRWGQAIRAFISGIAQLATLRQSLGDLTHRPSTPDAAAPTTPGPRSNWRDIDITAPDRTALQHHESNVDLSSLTLDTTLGLYTHPTTKKHFGAVEGKVYPVAKRGIRWRIVNKRFRGPYLRQSETRQWVLDKVRPAPRFGLLNRLETLVSVWDGMNVEASGMPEIRRLFPQKARQIDAALDLATFYAWNSVRNLQLLKNTDDTITPVHQLIMDFIGVQQVLPAQVELIEKIVGEMFEALLDPTLRARKSNRFVVGRVTEDAEHTFGFIVPTDSKRKIHLAEKFFKPNFSHYRAHLLDPAFPIKIHSRAVTLIHEISHIACKTEDIAYLDPSRPFVDLIGSSSQIATQMKRALEIIQGTALSIKTPYTQLFKRYDPDSNEWQDFGETPYEDTERLKELVLALTRSENLSGARHTFKKNPLVRLTVQLANADSVAWLITHLGRQLHASTP
ncbi:dermonecrotic toxin domain-containing protein [Pseudomonas sp. NPDC086278]|uniref:dermonecrotic toxin domain-containing protein n=1 Tax=Pseudomonas sp. NPDC086278 TaxID=3390646 RepID=UPI003CFE35C9